MGGTRNGGLQAAKTNKAKYGNDFYAKIGKIGGRAGVPKGFAKMPPHLRSEYGRIGGSKSRRPSKKTAAAVKDLGYKQDNTDFWDREDT